MHARLSRACARVNANVDVYTSSSCVHVCWKIPHTPAFCRYSRMTMVEQELAASRVETRYLCRRWEENRRIKAVFAATAFWTVCACWVQVRFPKHANTGMDASQSLLSGERNSVIEFVGAAPPLDYFCFSSDKSNQVTISLM